MTGVRPGGVSWMDRYSVGNQCYCNSTFDHAIGNIRVNTPKGTLTLLAACKLIGPGRVDIDRDGCGHIGPKWNFNGR